MLCLPRLGDLDVNAIDTSGVLEVLRPIWAEKTETASRLRQRIEAVLDYATALGVRRRRQSRRAGAAISITCFPSPAR